MKKRLVPNSIYSVVQVFRIKNIGISAIKKSYGYPVHGFETWILYWLFSLIRDSLPTDAICMKIYIFL